MKAICDGHSWRDGYKALVLETTCKFRGAIRSGRSPPPSDLIPGPSRLVHELLKSEVLARAGVYSPFSVGRKHSLASFTSSSSTSK